MCARFTGSHPEKVANVKPRDTRFDISGSIDERAAVASLAGLAHATRLRIYRHLVRYEPTGLPAGALADALDLPPATLSFHLKHLCQVGLCRDRRAGRQIYYRARITAVAGLIDYLTENCCQAQPEPIRECL